jgi:ligand-binding SRPBCC domain-containing protein
MKFEHRLRVKASRSEVAAYHSRAASMPAITPPSMIVRMHRVPVVLGAGDEMGLRRWPRSQQSLRNSLM